MLVLPVQFRYKLLAQNESILRKLHLFVCFTPKATEQI